VKKESTLVVLAYVGICAIWGTTWLAIKGSLLGMPPLAGAGVRFVIAGLVLYACALAFRFDLRRQAPPLHLVLVLAATMFGLNYALTYTAETGLSSGLVAVLFGMTPFFVFAFAHFMTSERMDARTMSGAALALAGVALISLVGNVHGGLWFVVAAVGGAASSGYATVYLKQHSAAEPLVTLPPAMLLAGASLFAIGLAVEPIHWHRAIAPATLSAIAYLAVCGSAIAFYLNHWLLQRVSSGVVGLSALIIPVVAVFVGVAFGGEAFEARDIAGGLLVLAGVALAIVRRDQRVPLLSRPQLAE